MVPVYIYYVSLQALGPDSASVFLASRPGVAGGSWRSSYFCFERTKISSIRRHFYVQRCTKQRKEEDYFDDPPAWKKISSPIKITSVSFQSKAVLKLYDFWHPYTIYMYVVYVHGICTQEFQSFTRVLAQVSLIFIRSIKKKKFPTFFRL